jgi:hypothetical protein
MTLRHCGSGCSEISASEDGDTTVPRNVGSHYPVAQRHMERSATPLRNFRTRILDVDRYCTVFAYKVNRFWAHEATAEVTHSAKC